MNLLVVRKRILKRSGNWAMRAMFRLSSFLTPRRIETLAGVISGLAYHLSRKYQRIAVNNLTMVYGSEYSQKKIREMVREVFRHFVRGALEFFYLAQADRSEVDRMIDVTGEEHLESAVEAGHGTIVITAHFGNWELLARKMCNLGYQVTVIARDSDDPGMTGVTNKIREGAGYRVLGRDKSVRGAIECLKRNEILGILPDQNVVSGGILVDFFGKPATTATGPAVFALKTGAKVVPAFAHRGEDGKYHGVFYPAIEYEPTGNKELDEIALTTAINKSIEMAIRKHPTQWLWLHDRWKSAREIEKGNGR